MEIMVPQTIQFLNKPLLQTDRPGRDLLISLSILSAAELFYIAVGFSQQTEYQHNT